MSVIIKGLDMPSSCLDCQFMKNQNTSLGIIGNCTRGCGSVIGFATNHYVNSRHPNCPIVKLPEQHGRLIDVDSTIADLQTVDPRYETMIKWCIQVLEAQPTVIEREDK